VSDGDALLAAILANPDEDTPRLVFADYLQENGEQARAEFVRVQMELARFVEPVAGNGVRYFRGDTSLPVLRRVDELESRERELLTCPDVITATTVNAPGLCLRQPDGIYRGFVECLTLSAADWLRHAEAIRTEHPVRKVTLTARPNFSSITNNTFQGILSAGHSERRVTCPREAWLAKLEQFDSDRLKAMLALLWPGITFDFA
jgi:uncharacterized protein (TIGR02996 family)